MTWFEGKLCWFCIFKSAHRCWEVPLHRRVKNIQPPGPKWNHDAWFGSLGRWVYCPKLWDLSQCWLCMETTNLKMNRVVTGVWGIWPLEPASHLCFEASSLKIRWWYISPHRVTTSFSLQPQVISALLLFGNITMLSVSSHFVIQLPYFVF